MKDTQTPRNKDISHRRPKDYPSSKSLSDQYKKLQKISKKSLNFDFAPVPEESLNEAATDSPNSFAISETLNNTNHFSEPSDNSDNSIGSENQSKLTSDEASRSFTVTPISMVKDETDNPSVGRCKEIRSNNTVEVDVVLNLLKQARIEVSRSTDVSASSKKYLDALIDAYMRDLRALPDEGDEYNALLSKRLRVVVICFVVWLITVTTIMIRWLGTRNSFFNSPPT